MFTRRFWVSDGVVVELGWDGRRYGFVTGVVEEFAGGVYGVVLAFVVDDVYGCCACWDC